MTGPEHYVKAEQLIEDAHQVQAESGPGCGSEEILAEAQVHATLALAAATADAVAPALVAQAEIGDRGTVA